MDEEIKRIKSQTEFLEDPTENVKALMEASIRHLTKMLKASDKFYAAEIAHNKELLTVQVRNIKELIYKNELHSKEIADKETDRINAINTVNVNAAQSKADAVLVAVNLLAKSTSEANTTLATSNAAINDGVQKRLGALEVSRAEGQGKSAYTDPMMKDFMMDMKDVLKEIAKGSGKEIQTKNIWGYVATGAVIIGAVVGVIVKLL